MASTVPAKSQPLHNFDLHLKWNKDGNSSGQHQRRRSIKSPSRRPNASSSSPLRHSPLRDSVLATPPRLQSPLSDSVALSARESPAHGDFFMKQSPIRGESSRPSPIREWTKFSVSGGELERLAMVGGEGEMRFLNRDSPLESEALRKSEGTLIEYGRNHSGNSAFEIIKNGVYSSNLEGTKQKLEKKSRATEIAGNKRSKLLIRIPCKSNKSEEENPQEASQKTDNNDEHGETDEVQEEAKTDEETKTWNLRPRKPLRKSQNVTSSAEKGNASVMPEKSKAQLPSTNAN
ncbi:hypothetical protein CDL12_06616 [Handroanthus impetiginosus]|uniref:Uncharacterized protein n=1 Tax=Handroanthus impetiginosus TaxID=429701 RepID=A0A2G9HTP9_9LAMI|nr:hypothetical protein CDL12_06616 [Handroanthus impetiginosus]